MTKPSPETRGTVFDIKELAVYDGPGIRTTVFLKGCPLRCAWCHNPEGLSATPQVMVNTASCVGCGRCRVPGCDRERTGVCSGCGRCVPLCPNGFRSISGRVYSARELAEKLFRAAPMFGENGGVTFSGGEPTFQADFLAASLDCLRAMMAERNVRFTLGIQTCGFCRPLIFADIVRRCDFLFFDIKHTDRAAHIKYTGVPNDVILENLDALTASGVPFIARLPLIPGVNDSVEELAAAARLLAGRPNLLRAELLPYNMAAGAKYRMVGLKYSPPFEERIPVPDTAPFAAAGIETAVL